jgi:hypothetical protein
MLFSEQNRSNIGGNYIIVVAANARLPKVKSRHYIT